MLLLYLFLDDGRCDTANHCIILLYFLYRTNFSGDGNQTAGGGRYCIVDHRHVLIVVKAVEFCCINLSFQHGELNY